MLSNDNPNAPISPTLPPKPGRRRTMPKLLFFLVLFGGLAGGYVYQDELRNSKVGELLGIKKEPVCDLTPEQMEAARKQAEQAQVPAPAAKPKKERKILYYVDPMNPALKSDKGGKAPCGMDMVPIYAEEEPDGPEEQRKVLYWVDPMDPNMRSDKPGISPMGMEMVPVYADAGTERLPPGTVKISPQKQQLIGVKYGEVVARPLSKTIRTVGRLTIDETRISHIHTKISGWVDQVYVDFTGKQVKKGQPLVSIYSPELVATQQELLIAKRSKDTLANSPFKQVGSNALSLYDSTRERLRLWDISEQQIKEIEKRGTPNRTLTLYSPIEGFVTNRNVFPGQQVAPEMELYTLANLSNIWVLADVYEYELPMIQVGQTANMNLTYFPGKTFAGKVTYINPGLEQMTRTLKVRIEFSNPGFQLKPDMYANVELKIDYGEQLAVARDAVLDSGSDQVVFVAREGGYFEPRRVKLGQQVGDYYIVLDGVKAGDRVVTSANFLIDSESQLKSAIGGMAAAGHEGHGGEAPAGTDEKGKKPDPPKEAPPSTKQPTGHEGHGK